LSVGANATIANYIGQRDTKKIRDAIHTVMVVAWISGIFLIFLGFFVSRPMLTLINTPEDVMEQAILYLRIYFCGMPFVMTYNFGSAILRSKGDSKRPLYCLLVSGVVNILLNLLFVIVFQMGVAGVGIATVTANAVSASLILYFLMHEEPLYRLNLRELRIEKSTLSRILAIGIPAGVQGIVFSLSNVCVQSAVNSFGSSAVAGNTVAYNFECFSYFAVNAFGQTAVTFTGQNFGAGDVKRCKKIFWICLAGGALCSAVLSVPFGLGRYMFAGIYAVDKATIGFAVIRIAHVAALEYITSVQEIGAAALRGMGHSVLPAILTIFGTCILRVIWVFTIFPNHRSFDMLMNVYPVTWIVTGAMMLLSYFVIRKKEFRRIQPA
jgi:putative MATE family efflux protein